MLLGLVAFIVLASCSLFHAGGAILLGLLLGLVGADVMEEYLRRALLVSRGDQTAFVRHPASAVMLTLSLLLLTLVLMPPAG